MLQLSSSDKKFLKGIVTMEGLLYDESQRKELEGLSERLEKQAKTTFDVLFLFHICPPLIKAPAFKWLRDKLCLVAVQRFWSSEKDERYWDALDMVKSRFYKTRRPRPELSHQIAREVEGLVYELSYGEIMKIIIQQLKSFYETDDDGINCLAERLKIKSTLINKELQRLHDKVDELTRGRQSGMDIISLCHDEILSYLLRDDKSGFWNRFLRIKEECKKLEKRLKPWAVREVAKKRKISEKTVKKHLMKSRVL